MHCMLFFPPILTDNQINGCSLDKAEERAKRDLEAKTAERAITEEHISYVTGMDQKSYFFKRSIIGVGMHSL